MCWVGVVVEIPSVGTLHCVSCPRAQSALSREVLLQLIGLPHPLVLFLCLNH